MNENELVKQHLGLVINIAKSFHPKNGDELDDFIQEGSIALLKAIRRFKAKKKTKLSTYAWTYITRALIRYKNNNKNKIKYKTLIDTADKEYYNFSEILPEHGKLCPIELVILNMRYEGYTLQEIADICKQSKSWASKKIKNLLEKIKKYNE